MSLGLPESFVTKLLAIRHHILEHSNHPIWQVCWVKLSCPITDLDRLLGLQEVEAPRIYRKSAHEGGKYFSPTHRPHLPSTRYSATYFRQRLRRPHCHSAAGSISQWKTPMTPSWIEPDTFGLAAQCVNHQHDKCFIQCNSTVDCQLFMF